MSLRVDHVGSLVRPKDLFDARKAGNTPPDILKAKEDAAVAHVVQLQRDLGLATITDGEMHREVYFEGVFDKMEGITLQPNRPLSEFQGFWPFVKILGAMGMPEYPSCYCTGKIKRTTPWFVEDFKALKSLVPAQDVSRCKITLCPPNWFHQRHGSDGTYDKSVYASDDEYFDDVGAAYRAEIKELYDLGCRNIQFDDSTFCFFCNDETIKAMQGAGVDPDALLSLYISAVNRCTADRPADLKIAMHMCHGNMGGMHFSEGGYGRIAEKVFNTLDIDTFYLEYDTERSGDFAPLRYMPPNKAVVLGLVTTKSPQLEDAELLIARIHEAADVIVQGVIPRTKEDALNQLYISGQCGFASIWQGNPVTEEDEKAKVRLMAGVAKAVWGA